MSDYFGDFEVGIDGLVDAVAGTHYAADEAAQLNAEDAAASGADPDQVQQQLQSQTSAFESQEDSTPVLKQAANATVQQVGTAIAKAPSALLGWLKPLLYVAVPLLVLVALTVALFELGPFFKAGKKSS